MSLETEPRLWDRYQRRRTSSSSRSYSASPVRSPRSTAKRQDTPRTCRALDRVGKITDHAQRTCHPGLLPRYEKQRHGFWEIEQQGVELSIRYGAHERSAKTRALRFNTAAEARAALEQKINYQLRKGFQLVPMANNDSLERAMLADPSDVGGYLVYADWLQGQQDPRGELIAIQAQLSAGGLASNARKNLRKRESMLLKKNAAALFGPLHGYRGKYELMWRWGFLRRLTMMPLRSAWKVEEPSTPVALDCLHHPSGKVLERLSIVLSSIHRLDRHLDDLLSFKGPHPLLELSVTLEEPPRGHHHFPYYDRDFYKLELQLQAAFPSLRTLELPPIPSRISSTTPGHPGRRSRLQK